MFHFGSSKERCYYLAALQKRCYLAQGTFRSLDARVTRRPVPEPLAATGQQRLNCYVLGTAEAVDALAVLSRRGTVRRERELPALRL